MATLPTAVRKPPPRPTTKLPEMHWAFVQWTRQEIELAKTGDSKTARAILIPDGRSMTDWVWVRVPVHTGLRRALTIDDLNTDIWIDASRGAGSATSDLTGRSFQINRFPLDEPRDLAHSYTIVVAPQHTKGPNVHPENHLINKLVPELEKPWRGNVLIFRHSKSTARFVINIEDERSCTGVEWVIPTNRVLRPRNYPQPGVMHAFWTTRDVVLYMLRFLNLLELVHFSHLNQRTKGYVKVYLKGRVTRYTSSFFPPKLDAQPWAADNYSILHRFFLALHVTRSWIVGSVALAAASTLSDAPCPSNMNIITTGRQLAMLVKFFEKEAGFVRLGAEWGSGAYANAGRLVWMKHPLVNGKHISITSAWHGTLGPLFFMSPNTDQMIAIAGHELITPVLHNVAEQRHLIGCRPTSRSHPSVLPPQRDRTYRLVPPFPDATTLEHSTANWGKPCGYSCPAIWRAATGLKGFAHIKWGGVDGRDEETDSALVDIGHTRLTFTLGGRCLNQFCPNSPDFDDL
ncbi:hypothetical protein B0H12DRAFT_1068158 [Mycena haematopus]|nr:hypothetical protein B0H12DRAFT_1068158 [Mycena haematopus]